MAETRGITPGVVYVHTVYEDISDTIAAGNQKAVECAGAKGVMLTMSAKNIGNARAMTLTVDVSGDNGTTYTGYNMLIDNVANSNAQTLLRLASKVRNANGSDILWMTPETLGGITNIKLKAARTNAGDAGTFTIKATVIF